MNLHRTSEVALSRGALPPTNIPLRLAARQMRWLRQAFTRHAQTVEKHYGCTFVLDTTRLGTAFVQWLRALRHERRQGADRKQYIDFSASLMLQELIAAAPLTCRIPPDSVNGASPITIWPEGFTYTYFCMAVLTAVREQEFERCSSPLQSRMSDLAFWNSYRENCLDDHRIASGFFQMMLGYKPCWDNPAIFVAFSQKQQTWPVQNVMTTD